MPKIDLYQLGTGGVNLVKNPLQLADNEITQGQNAELVPDESKGGEGALSKRLGLAALTSALGATIHGMGTLPLQTTYTRYLYVALQTADSDRWLTSTDGTTFTATSSPLLAASEAQFGSAVFAGGHRTATFATTLYYPGNAYTAGSASPPLVSWDNTNAFTVGLIPNGPSSTTYCEFISDMLVANGKVYFCVHDLAATTPNARGRVISFDPKTGQMSQIAEAFGASPYVTGGYPICLAFYNGQLWAGLDDRNSGVGKVVRCYPDVDETWTVDSSALNGPVYSLREFQGNLYAASFAGGSPLVEVRTASTGAWTTSYTMSASGTEEHLKSLIEFNSELYAVEYEGTTPTIHIKKFDGATWTTDRDLDATDSAVAGNYPENFYVFNSALFLAVRSTTVGLADGFLMKKASGTWSKIVPTENISGYLGELIVRT